MAYYNYFHLTAVFPGNPGSAGSFLGPPHPPVLEQNLR